MTREYWKLVGLLSIIGLGPCVALGILIFWFANYFFRLWCALARRRRATALLRRVLAEGRN